MSSWNEVSSRKKPVEQEETFYLSSLIDGGGCIRCMTNSCRINNKHGIFYPDRIAPFVKNPTYIDGINQSIQKAKLNFNGFVPIYTTCIFSHINKECKNCKEGRVKYIDFQNTQIMMCYPPMESVKHKIPVGLHIDIKLILKGKKFEVTVIPFEIKKQIVAEVEKVKEDTSSFNEFNFPSLENMKTLDKISTKPISFSSIISNKEKPIHIVEKVLYIDETHVVVHQSFDEALKDTASCKDDTSSKDTVSQRNDASQRNDDILKKEIQSLKIENEKLKNQNTRELLMIKNKEKYHEMFDNMSSLNTRVTEQFFNTEYSDYLMVY